jgi:hypothetical protein
MALADRDIHSSPPVSVFSIFSLQPPFEVGNLAVMLDTLMLFKHCRMRFLYLFSILQFAKTAYSSLAGGAQKISLGNQKPNGLVSDNTDPEIKRDVVVTTHT